MPKRRRRRRRRSRRTCDGNKHDVFGNAFYFSVLFSIILLFVVVTIFALAAGRVRDCWLKKSGKQIIMVIASDVPSLLHLAAIFVAWVGKSAEASLASAWHFTDVHLDPIYVVNSSTDNFCNGNVTPNVSLQAPPFGASVGDCATPRALYKSAVQWMADQKPADFVLFTGDFTQAGLSSEEAVLGTIAEATIDLKTSLPNAAILGAVGNHDSYPGDVFDYPFQKVYAHFAELWSLDAVSQKTVLEGGYFSMRAAEEPPLQVISLNTNYLATLNPLVKNTSSAAYKFGFTMMDWFADELEKADADGASIWVLGHIPGESWLPAHSLKYQKLIQAHENAIKGQFFGHDHEDYTRLTRACNNDSMSCDGRPTGVVWIGPSLTEGFPAENPGIRLYEFDSANEYSIIDATTFTADLIKSNEEGVITWVKEYSTREEYGLSDLSPDSWENWINGSLTSSQDAFARHVALRKRLYAGPPSRYDPPPCLQHDEACAQSMRCKLGFFDDAAAALCASSSS